MKVHALNFGTLTFPGGALVCHCWVIEAPDGLVLVDGGLGVPDVQGGRLPLFFRSTTRRATLQETALHQLPAGGLDVRDVKHVLVTHLDLDHAGGLTDFPDATVHVLRAELDAAHSPRGLLERRRYIPAQLQGVRFQAHDPKETWNGFAATGPLPGLPDAIRLVSLPGHSRGHAGVALRRDDRWWLHCGDAWFHKDDLEAAGPPLLRTFQAIVATDRLAAHHTRSRLRELEQTSEVWLANTHDPRVLEKFRSG
jgi:glyoxylase-like metal-dependent hydrolase (beta-lactamase superfamily II)